MTLSVLLLLIVSLGLIAGLVWYFRPETEPITAPEHGHWADDRITPLAMGPRNRVAERVARGPVLTQAVTVAVAMARADGHVREAEEQAIRQFILDHVTEADDALANRAVEEGLAEVHTTESIEKAIDTIRAVASEEQRRLIIQLLAHVAGVDGAIDEKEREFMHLVGTKMGLSGPAVDHLLQTMVALAKT